jgi:pyruvate formate lyase activating enzyme
MIDAIPNRPGRELTRRQFLLKTTYAALLAGGAGTLLPPILDPGAESPFGGTAWAAPDLDDLLRQAPVARYWVSTATAGGDCLACHTRDELGARTAHDHDACAIKCLLCAQGCLLHEGERGRCRARIHIAGELRSLVYGRPVSVHVDPIEKKPFFHFLPGSQALSISTAGCPLSCKFCQNWELSQAKPEDFDVAYTPPIQVAGAARQYEAPIVAFTYNEPTVFVEYFTDVAREARKAELRSVLISCGFMTEAPLAEMCSVLDAIKIDLKGFSRSFYRNVCHAELDPVLRSIRQAAKSGTHLEIVNLVVPTLNDSDQMLTGLAEWVVQEAGPDVPVHFTRFHPDYQMRNLPPTPVATLERAREIAMAKGIRYAYVGNVPGHAGNSTYCPKCGATVIERKGFFIMETRMRNGCCTQCGAAIAGVWQ